MAFLGKVAFGTAGTTPSEFGLLGGELLAHLRHRSQDGLIQVFQDMECTDLMRHVAKDGLNRGRIQRRTIGGDAPQRQVPGLEHAAKAAEKGDHVGLGRVVL